MKSKDAYLMRKRDSQRHRIVEAEKMVGKKIEVRKYRRVRPSPKVGNADLQARRSHIPVRGFPTALP